MNVVPMSDDKPSAMELALAQMRRDMDAVIEYQKIQAKIRRKAYEAYLAEGFTKDEALPLCAK